MRNRSRWLGALALLMSCSPGCDKKTPVPEPVAPKARFAVQTSCGQNAIACYDGFARQPANLVCFRPSSRWSHTTLTWNIANPVPSIDSQVQEMLATAAFSLWDDASALSFVQVPATDKADICIHFDSGSDNGAFPFDGPGGHLGLSYFPGSPRPGAIYLSDVETWTVPPSEAEYLLYVVLVHEIGHALGLEHSLTPGTIMWPNYQGPIAGLSPEDEAAIQRLYGSADGKVAPLEVLPTSACTPPENLTALGDPDTDGDGIPDSIEVLVLGTDPLEGDTDRDGGNDFTEVFVTGTSPTTTGGGTEQNSVSSIEPPPGIIAWWPLDETSGTIAEDIVGGKSGIHVNGPVPAEGMVGGSLRFDGANDYITVPDNDLWALGARDFTIELWANFDAAGGGSVGRPGDVFIGNDEGPFTQNKWFFALGGGYLNFHINGPGTGSVFMPRALFSPTVGQWYHLAVRRNGNNYTIFINGNPAASETDTRIIPNPNAPLTIGQAEGLGFMSGRLDEISIYDRALTYDEIRAIHDAGPEGKYKGGF